jgi:hypothetical protein
LTAGSLAASELLSCKHLLLLPQSQNRVQEQQQHCLLLLLASFLV